MEHRELTEPKPTAGACQPDPDSSPFELHEIEGLPFARDSVEAQAIRRVRSEYATARAAVGPGELAYTDDSPFGIPPRD
jgi:hypothetical protein